MHRIKLIFLGIILGIIPSIALAQNNTNSPYTRYGYGNLADKSFISQRGMGGIGYGLRNPQMINSMNPASFSAVDSMTFMFDFGITGQASWLKEGAEREHLLNGNLEYLALQFPVSKRIGVGAGFEPISYVGYKYGDTARLSVDSSLYQKVFSGSGGLSRVYVDLSYDLLNRLSVGVKLSYAFGDIIHDNRIQYSSGGYASDRADTIRSYGLLYDFGLQYHQEIGKFRMITIGAVYTPKTRLGTRVRSGAIRYDANGNIQSNPEYWVSQDSVFEMPESYGLGFTYSRLGRLTVGADVLYQRWADVKYYNETNTFNNRLKLNAGGEFIPNRTSNNLLNRMRYRAGLYYSNSYLNVQDSKYNEYGIGLGLGIPLPNKRSFVNLAFEYSRVQPVSNNLIDEQYFKISLSYTFNEQWFRKLRIQ
jgi:hypothetical protein